MRFPFLVLFILVFHSLYGQIADSIKPPVFKAQSIEVECAPCQLELKDFRIYSWDHARLATILQEQSDSLISLRFHFDEINLLHTLQPYVPSSGPAAVTLLTLDGIKQIKSRPTTTWKGHSSSGSVRWTITPSHLSGSFYAHGDFWLIEPLWYHLPEADRSFIVLYKADDAWTDLPMVCGSDLLPLPEESDFEPPETPISFDQNRSAGCKIIDYAVAVDWLFFDKYGSADEVMNRIQTIISLVEEQYTGHFNNDYIFPIVEWVISSCSSCDPPEWSNNTDATLVLGNFRDWGVSGGFPGSWFDVAGLWTARTFNNNVLGVAYLQGVCNNQFRYQALRDFSSTNSLMRAMVSHEFGHNFSAVHDADQGYIMSTPLNNTTLWSSLTLGDINPFMANRPCLSNCFYIPPPIAAFSASPTTGCAPLHVAFTDESTFDPETWSWTFPGGSPVHSSDQHPEITWSSYGQYMVSLTVTNQGGNNTLLKNQYILVNDKPLVSFDIQPDGKTVYFTNTTFNGLDAFWDFGDGQQSTEDHPTHHFAKDGTYLIQLISNNACGQQSASQYLTIETPPTADFRADTLWGCAPLTVAFIDKSSSNTTNWIWSFPGGQPDTSTLQNPVVTYSAPGIYTVILESRNGVGRDTLIRSAYIEILPSTDTSFSIVQNKDSIHVGYAGGVDSLWWDFGDGSGSADSIVAHRYAHDSTYTLTLTLWTICGIFSMSQQIIVITSPNADFRAQPVVGCMPLSVLFENRSSSNTDSLFWFFPGANPSSSQDTSPVVIYALPGWYDVCLIATNTSGSDTIWLDSLVHVREVPYAQFTYNVTGLDVLFQSQSQEAEIHLWEFGDSQSGSGQEILHTYSSPGSYEIEYFAINTCGADSLTQELLLDVTSIESSKNDAAWRVWPIPAGSTLYIEGLKPSVLSATYQLYTLTGQIVLAGNLTTGVNQLFLTAITPGPYLLQCLGHQEVWTTLIVVE